mmetsp:Transcript_115621/g.332029  ORF Transcript_115621/g.332029 Transcript_115621/m.332029 type:complete len:219 (+) Transcript_115621:411-1067(+)
MWRWPRSRPRLVFGVPRLGRRHTRPEGGVCRRRPGPPEYGRRRCARLGRRLAEGVVRAADAGAVDAVGADARAGAGLPSAALGHARRLRGHDRRGPKAGPDAHGASGCCAAGRDGGGPIQGGAAGRRAGRLRPDLGSQPDDLGPAAAPAAGYPGAGAAQEGAGGGQEARRGAEKAGRGDAEAAGGAAEIGGAEQDRSRRSHGQGVAHHARRPCRNRRT